MKFTLGWLKDHLDTDADVRTVAEALTRIGLEVESVTDPAARLAPFRIARVLSAEPHPQADKLRVLRVDTGDGEPVQVVCGAPNARAGLVGVFGGPGDHVPGLDVTLQVASIRGVESRGMMCSERELELSDAHEGIIDLPADAPVGAGYAAWAGLDDPVFEIAVLPNRQDCMGVMGVARDLAAAGLGTFRPTAPALVEGGYASPVPVATDDAAGCPAFFGQCVRGVRNGVSPAWLQRRLRAVGQKPITALVDITNYVSIGWGRPLHVYDVAKLTGTLRARAAVDGETVEALNGKTYALTAGMTVIADDVEVHDIGGIMGGIRSGVSEATTDVLIECAYFTPERIGVTGRALGLVSDARARFERGVDPAFLDAGLALATRLVLELCGGAPSRVMRAGTPPDTARSVAFRPERVRTLGGLDVGADEQAAILGRLGFAVERGEPWQVSVPSWRRDVDGEADIVEEVVRIAGLDRVSPAPLPGEPGVARAILTSAQRIERVVRRTLAARGGLEAVTWSFLSPVEAAAFGGAAFTLDNPISADLAALRPSLLPGLLTAARRNVDRGQSGLRLFELGRRYLADGERAGVAVLLVGERDARDWRRGRAAAFDAFDAKAEALAALAAAGTPVDNLQVLPPADGWWHPGRSGRLALGPRQVLADFGELHPDTLRAFDLKTGAVAAELYLDALPPARRTRGAYAPPALQPVLRDFAFVVPADLPAATLLRAVRGAERAAITAARLFDRFAGSGLEPGMVSLAVEVTFQPGERSFTDVELDALSTKVVAAAAKIGARLRD